MSQYVRNMGAMIGQSTIQRLMGMLTTIVLARVLGSANFGIYSIVVNTASSAYGLVRLGVDAAIHVHTAEHHSDTDTRNAKGQMLGAGLVLLSMAGIFGAVICLVFAQWIAVEIYGKPGLEQWIRLAAFLVFLQSISQFVYTLLAGLHRFKDYAKVMVISVSASAVVLSISSFFGGLHGALFGLIAMQTVTLWLLYRRARAAILTEHISLQFRRFTANATHLLKTGFPFYAAGLLSVPSAYYVQGLLTQNSGLEAMGGLRVITSITTLVSFVPTAIAAVMVSHLTRSSTSDYTDFVRTTLLNVKYIWLFVLIAGAGILTFLPLLVNVLFGQTYKSYTAPASLAILSSVLACLMGVVGNISFSRKRVSFIFFYTMIQTAFFLFTALFYVPLYGLSGYFFAELFGLVSALGFIWLTTSNWRKRNLVSPPWLTRLLTISCAYTVFFILAGIFGSDVTRSVFGSISFVLLMGLGYWYVLDTEERGVFSLLIQGWLVKEKGK